MKLSLILKIAIAVITAIAGLLGVSTLSSCTAGITMGKSNSVEQRVINSVDSTTLVFGLYPVALPAHRVPSRTALLEEGALAPLPPKRFYPCGQETKFLGEGRIRASDVRKHVISLRTLVRYVRFRPSNK